MTRHYFTLAFLGLNLAWSLLMVAAPFVVDGGAARGLDGYVNQMDHADRWEAFPWPARLAYAMGDLQCHQMESRSWLVNGNQFPVDVRMFAMFLAGNVGFALVFFLPNRTHARDAVLTLVPPRWRSFVQTPKRRLALLTGLLVVGLLPTAIDGFTQLWTHYESTNPTRAVTGAWMGLVGALWLGAVFDALNQPLSPAASTRQHREARGHE